METEYDIKAICDQFRESINRMAKFFIEIFEMLKTVVYNFWDAITLEIWAILPEGILVKFRKEEKMNKLLKQIPIIFGMSVLVGLVIGLILASIYYF